ncbi:hypothetical protein Trydic_g17153 [Trypoxylus dichotomus]
MQIYSNYDKEDTTDDEEKKIVADLSQEMNNMRDAQGRTCNKEKDSGTSKTNEEEEWKPENEERMVSCNSSLTSIRSPRTGKLPSRFRDYN